MCVTVLVFVSVIEISGGSSCMMRASVSMQTNNAAHPQARTKRKDRWTEGEKAWGWVGWGKRYELYIVLYKTRGKWYVLECASILILKLFVSELGGLGTRERRYLGFPSSGSRFVNNLFFYHLTWFIPKGTVIGYVITKTRKNVRS